MQEIIPPGGALPLSYFNNYGCLFLKKMKHNFIQLEKAVKITQATCYNGHRGKGKKKV